MDVTLFITLCCNNKSMQLIASNPSLHGCMKHIDINVYLTRDQVIAGFSMISHIPSWLQLANMLTLTLGETPMCFICFKLGFQEDLA